MQDFTFAVTVEAEDIDQARRVMSERIGHDEDYGFEYTIDWTTDPSPAFTAGPELLEACKAAHEQFATLDDADELTESDLSAWTMVREAIAKATGKDGDA